MKKYFSSVFLVLLTIITLLGAGLRFFKLGSTPVSLYWDETAMYVDAKVVAATGLDMHQRPFLQALYPSYGDYKLPIYIITASASFFILGASEFALRLPSALAGIGSIILIGFLAKQVAAKVYSTTQKQGKARLTLPDLVGVSAAFVMAVSPWSILFSRTAFEGHLAQFLVVASICTLLFGHKQNLLILVSLLLGSLATYTYFSVRFVWPVVFLASWLWIHSETLTKHISSIKTPSSLFSKQMTRLVLVPILICLGYWLTLLPMTQSPLYAQSNQFRLSTSSVLNQFDYPVLSNQLREAAGNSLLDRVIFHRHVLLIRELAHNYADFFDFSYLFLTGDQNLRHGTTTHGLFLTPFLVTFVLGTYLLARKSPTTLFLLVTWWIIGVLPAAVPEDTPHALRSLNALAPVTLVISFGFAEVLHQVRSINWKKHLSLNLSSDLIIKSSIGYVCIAFVAMVLFSLVEFTVYYFQIYPQQSAYDWQDGYKQLADYVLEEKDAVRTVWINPFEDRFYLWLLAYGEYSAEEIQAMEKDDFKVKQIDNIVFTRFDWSKLSTLDHKVLIVDQPNAIEDNSAGAPIEPEEDVVITGSFNQREYYRVVRYQP